MSSPRANTRGNGYKGGNVTSATDDNIFSAESKLTKENGELKLEIEKLKGALAYSQSELDGMHQRLQHVSQNVSNSSTREEELRLKVEYLELELRNGRSNQFESEINRLDEANEKLASKYDQLDRINNLQDEEIKELNLEIDELKDSQSLVKKRDLEIVELKSTLAATKLELARMTEATDTISNKKDLKEDTDSEVEVSKEEERTAANDEAVLKSGGNEELQRKLKNAEVELAETRKKLEKQIQRCEKFKDANNEMREELLSRDEEIMKLKNETGIHADTLEKQSLSLSQLVQFTQKVKTLEELVSKKDSEIAELTENTKFSNEKIEVLEQRLREAHIEAGNMMKEEIDNSNKVSSLEVEKRALELAVEAAKLKITGLEQEMSVIVSKSKEDTGNLQATIANLKKMRESLENTVEEMEEEIVNLKAKLKDGILKFESDEEYEEALAKIVDSIDMLAVLSKRNEELLEEYSEIVQMYNGEEGSRNNENGELLLDHLINLGIVELMVFELKKHQMYPRGGGLGRYKIRQLKRGIAAEALEQYSENFYDV